MKRPPSYLLWFVLAAVSACSDGERERRGLLERQSVLVFAAASLTACFQALAKDFEALHPDSKIDLHFAGTPQLVLQVREGAPVDVFASADEANMRRVIENAKVVGRASVFARNRLTIVVAKGNPKAVRGLADLARADLRVVLCGPEVPAGRYARQALEKAGVVVRSLSDEPSVQAVVNKLRLGEVDAGLVYVTDWASAQEDLDAVAVAGEHNVTAAYPIVSLGAGENRTGAALFVDFVLSSAGQALLQRYGFSSP